MKQRARQQRHNDKVELYKTGGGTFTATVTNNSEQIIQMLSDQFEPIENPYDSSPSYYGDKISEPNPNRIESEIPDPVTNSPTHTPTPPTTPVPQRKTKKRKAADEEYEKEKKKLILKNLRLDAEIKEVKLKMLYIELKKKEAENK